MYSHVHVHVLLAMCWSCAGHVLLVMCCCHVLVMCWSCACHVLLVMYCCHVLVMLCCWSCASHVLVLLSCCAAGHVLVMCCWLTRDWRLRCSAQTGQRQAALKSPHRSTRSACEGRRGGERGRGGGRRGKGRRKEGGVHMHVHVCIEKRKAMRIQYMYTCCTVHMHTCILLLFFLLCYHVPSLN